MMGKKVVTALGISSVNDQLIEQGVEVADIDLSSQEELFSWFENAEDSQEIDILIVLDKLKGPCSKQEWIEEICKLYTGEIIVLLEEPDDQKFISYLRKFKITKILGTNQSLEELFEMVIEKQPIEKDNNAVSDEKTTLEKVYIEKKVISVIGLGGCGKTTIALEIAKVLREKKYNVCVVDFNLEKSDVGYVIGIQDGALERVIKKEINEKAVKENLVEMDGITYFTGMKDLKIINDVEKKDVKAILKILRKKYDAVIIDTGNFTNEITHISIIESTHKVMVLNTAERTVRAAKRYIDIYKEIGVELKPEIVLNYYNDINFNSNDIEEILNAEDTYKIKYTSGEFEKIELNKGLKMKCNKQTIEKLVLAMFQLEKRKRKFRIW